jgi:hypothetical protein
MSRWLYPGGRNLSVSLAGGRPVLAAPLYGHSIALADLEVEDARIVNLQHEQNLRPRRRSNGAAMPGSALGRFKLKNGRKA